MRNIKSLITILFIFLLVSCSSFFQSKVPMNSDNNSAYLDDLLVFEQKKETLETPKQLIVSRNRYPNKIELAWNQLPNAEKKSIGYLIEFAVQEPKNDGTYDDDLSKLSYSILEESWYYPNYTHNINSTNIENYDNRYNQRYYYRITALSKKPNINQSNPTEPVYGELLAPPLGVSATGGASPNYIELNWNAVKGANKYEIFKSKNESGAGSECIATIYSQYGEQQYYKDKISSPDDKGVDFYYKVYAINKYGIKSEASSFAMGYSLIPGAPSKPTNVQFIEGRGNYPNKISLKWNTVTPGPGETITYNVYRNSSKDSMMFRAGKNIKVGEFVDRINLMPGVYYNYFVQTMVTKIENGKPVELKSAFSEPIIGYVLSAPEIIKTIKNSDGTINLSWEKPIGSEEEQALYRYKIYASRDINGSFEEKLETESLEANLAYYEYYKIATVNKQNQISNLSNVVSPTPDAVTGVKVTMADYSFLGDTFIANDAGVYPVKITWEKPAKENPLGYYIYRAEDPNSFYRKITKDVISDTSYIDTDNTLQPGKVYYYKVLSLNNLKQGDNYSEPTYGWGALTHERYLILFNETIISSQKKLSLMHKPGSTDKLGSESAPGTISGTIAYNARVAGIGAEITMRYDNYADFYVDPKNQSLGTIFTLTGNSDTSADMSSNGSMHGTITCSGMYPGVVDYGNIEIKSGAAGGGTYGVTPKGTKLRQVPYNKI